MTLDRAKLRKLILDLNEGDMEMVAQTTFSLKALGAVRNIHVGRSDLVAGSDEVVEWYAGQALDVLESRSWFAVNSVINCLDKFVPEPP